MRVGDVSGLAPNREFPVQRAPTTVFDRVTEKPRARGFANDAGVNRHTFIFELLHHTFGAFISVAFFVRSDQKSKRSRMIRFFLNQTRKGNGGCRNRSFHVGCASGVELAISHGRLKRRRCP